jgi:hypothetical protein
MATIDKDLLAIFGDVSSEDLAKQADEGLGKRELIPNGSYIWRVNAQEWKTSGPMAKSPGQKYFSVELEIVEGACAGRKMWPNFMVFASDPDQAKRAKSELGKLLSVTGAPATEPAKMLDKRLRMDVTTYTSKASGETQNGLQWRTAEAVAAKAGGGAGLPLGEKKTGGRNWG